MSRWKPQKTWHLAFGMIIVERFVETAAGAHIGTAHVDLEWIKPSKIGNEVTKDSYQIKTEAIQKYVATLRVVEQQPEPDRDTEKEGSDSNRQCFIGFQDISRRFFFHRVSFVLIV